MNKTDIINWVDKCQNKAVRSVQSELKNYLNNFAEKEKPEIISDCNLYQESINVIRNIESKYDLMPWTFSKLTVSFISGVYTELEGVPALTYKFLQNNKEYAAEFEKIKVLIDEIEAVRNEYKRLKNKIRSMRNITAMITYLKELGFDVETINEFPREQLNKDLLFVCKENKPDEN